jgi:oligopeptide/dipeptide ABC transporter ATP-binding protein
MSGTEKKQNHPVELPQGEQVKQIFDWDIRQQPAVSSDVSQDILQVKNLKMYFPVTKGLLKRKVADVKAVDDVNFAIKKGKTLGIVGESGSGKSTIGNCVMRNLIPTGGQIIYDGQDITNLDKRGLRQLHRSLQMITQDPYASLDPRMTIRQVILEGPQINHIGDPASREDLVDRMLMMVGLNPGYKNRYPHEFSGGQRQRISIARALAMSPNFIVCDEIVSALDVSIQAQIVGLMMKLQQELGITYIFIGHDLSVVRYLSDQVGVMYLGKIVELTDSEELYEHPIHPYTQALISAVPIPNPTVDRQRERILLEGEVPSPINPPKGCHFCTRCPYAMKRCHEEEPKLTDQGNNHFVACHLTEATH